MWRRGDPLTAYDVKGGWPPNGLQREGEGDPLTAYGVKGGGDPLTAYDKIRKMGGVTP